MCAHHNAGSRRNKSYILRGARMSVAQERAYRNGSARFIISYTKEPLSFKTLFNNDNPVICEIGFGMGSATAQIALAHPDINYLGIEVYKAGIGKLLWEIEKQHIENIRIVEYDAAEVFENMIPDASLAGIHIFFPDPWPKKRHHKRRLVQRPFTAGAARKLCGKGYLYMVTDWSEYAASALAELSETPGLRNAYENYAPARGWRPKTKFERKGLACAREIRELYFNAAAPADAPAARNE